MRSISFIALALVSVMTVAFISACGQRKTGEKAAEEAVKEAEAVVETVYTAIDKYIVETIGEGYEPSAYSIPFYSYTVVDDSDLEDIQVWGDFWLLNYNQSGDTLKTASGGAYPGKMHVKKTETGFEVTSFEAVGDGSEFTPTAKKIFGDKFDEFMAANSDDVKREAARLESIKEFVKANELPVKYYQDFGWPAVEIPSE